MRIVTASVARSHLSELLGEVAYAKVEVLITRRGKPLAKLVPVDQREKRRLRTILSYSKVTILFWGNGRPSGCLAESGHAGTGEFGTVVVVWCLVNDDTQMREHVPTDCSCIC